MGLLGPPKTSVRSTRRSSATTNGTKRSDALAKAQGTLSVSNRNKAVQPVQVVYDPNSAVAVQYAPDYASTYCPPATLTTPTSTVYQQTMPVQQVQYVQSPQPYMTAHPVSAHPVYVQTPQYVVQTSQPQSARTGSGQHSARSAGQTSARAVKAPSARYGVIGQTVVPALQDLPSAELHVENCICTICNCGKHACPPTPTVTHYDPQMKTEARSSFPGTYVAPVRVSKVEIENRGGPRKSAPFEGTSQYRQDYPKHPLQPRSTIPRTQDTGIGKSPVPFDGTTTNKQDFVPHSNVPPTRSAAPKNSGPLGSAPFEGSTEHRDQYIKKAVPAPRSKPAQTPPPSLPFQGTSTNKDDFPHHPNYQPSKPAMRNQAPVALPEDRDFTSVNKADFGPKKIRACPAIPCQVPFKTQHGHVEVIPINRDEELWKRKRAIPGEPDYVRRS